MNSSPDWAKAFARQADADFRSWDFLQPETEIPACHKLLFLQMACEKLCKAHLLESDAPAETVQTSHAYIAGPLPVVMKQQIVYSGAKVSKSDQRFWKDIRHLAREIEVLNPAVDRDRQRPDNCEYPWEDHGGTVHSPLDWTFHPSHLLTAPNGRKFLKLVGGAIKRMLET
jgi:hypothetical protein